jgi:proline dehydrogenase
MSLMRKALLAGSTNAWLRDHATQYGFVKRSVKRFWPGEHADDALRAAAELKPEGITTILTKLGENVTRPEEAEEVTQHYLEVLDKVATSGLDAQISVKPTQLGLDLDRALCERNLDRLVARAEERRNFLWIDMESSPYVDPTLDLYRRTRAKTSRIGIALQAYLYRTAKDVESLVASGPAIRIVKGAYLEPPDVAYPRKSDVDENFYKLCVRLLARDAQSSGTLVHIATHDVPLTDRLLAYIERDGVPASAYEVAMLYGIQRPQQLRLARLGKRVRVLISYGDYWFPWYMRRLAERPANVWFMLKNITAR